MTPIRRIHKAMTEIQALDFVSDVSVSGDNLLQWECVLWPNGYPFAPLGLKTLMKFPASYPALPVEVYIPKLTHPNLDSKSGKLDIGMLQDPHWSPTTSLTNILTRLASPNGVLRAPEMMTPVNLVAAAMLQERPRDYRRYIRRQCWFEGIVRPEHQERQEERQQAYLELEERRELQWNRHWLGIRWNGE